jgi:glycosyltransferase involved in cell wall biosynthesis
VTNLLIIQRFYPSFREGLFDKIAENGQATLICSAHQPGKIVHPEKIDHKNYVCQMFSFLFGNTIVIFPWLFFELIKLRPKYIVSEGGSNTVNNIAVWSYSKLFNAEYAIWDLGRAYKGKEKVSFLRRIYNRIYKKILNDARYVYVYNAVGKVYFSAFIASEKIINLRNTVDTTTILELKKKHLHQELTKDKRFSNYSYITLYVGALNEHKKLESLKDIFQQLPDDYCLIIVGGGDNNYIESLRHYLGFSDRIYFEGYKKITELPIYYHVADFVILPGLGGLSINQAMAFNKPVVCNIADGGEKELVKNNDTGFIYSNVSEAASFIESKSKSDWRTMGENAERLVYKHYSINNMVVNFLTITR